MRNRIKIIIADDHQIFIEGIRALLRDTDRITLVAEAIDGDSLLNLLKTKDVDVVLMDVNMPRMNGIEATRKIVSLYPDIKILGLTMHEDPRFISEMMKAGASGYLLKTTGKQELVEAISRVYAGERYLSNEVSMKLIDSMLDEGGRTLDTRTARNPQITKREQEIIKLIGEEMTNEEIARKLNNSPMTIITHRKNLLRKLGVKNTAGLMKYAMQHGLIQ